MQTDGLKHIKWLSSHRQAYGFSPQIYNNVFKLKISPVLGGYEYIDTLKELLEDVCFEFGYMLRSEIES